MYSFLIIVDIELPNFCKISGSAHVPTKIISILRSRGELKTFAAALCLHFFRALPQTIPKQFNDPTKALNTALAQFFEPGASANPDVYAPTR